MLRKAIDGMIRKMQKRIVEQRTFTGRSELNQLFHSLGIKAPERNQIRALLDGYDVFRYSNGALARTEDIKAALELERETSRDVGCS